MQQLPMKIENYYGELDNTQLKDTFYSNHKKGNIVHVSLNPKGLKLKRHVSSEEYKDHELDICDIIGGRCVWIQKSSNFSAVSTCGSCAPMSTLKKHNRTQESEDAYLYIFAYMLRKNFRNTLRRERTVITLRFRSYDNHEDNMREAEKWYKALKSYRNNYLLSSNVQCIVPCQKGQKSLQSKRLLILLNPKSGSGKARELFNCNVVTILNEADVAYDLHVTKHSNYANNFVRQNNLSIWSGIVAVGGDGLFHEILNGILKRKDWSNILSNVALGIIPCGSGNGLARSIAHYFQEPYEPKSLLGASLSLVSGRRALMDIVEIQQKNKMAYSFLSIGWGLISDIDIESERLRSLGYQRFTIWTLHRLINLRTYRGKISYLPKKNSDDENSTAATSRTNLQRIHVCDSLPPSEEMKKYEAASNIYKEGFEDIISLQTVANQSYRSRCNSLLSTSSRLSTYYSIAESIYHSIPGNSECCEEDSNSQYVAETDINHIEQFNNTLPSLKDNLPNTWFVEAGDFVMIHAVYQTHLGSDCYFSPYSKLNDGVIYLVMIRGGISRSQLFNFLINMSSGTHLPTENNPFISVEKVVAFRLEPYDENSILTVDGERIEVGSLQARIIPGVVNVMVPNNVACKDC